MKSLYRAATKLAGHSISQQAFRFALVGASNTVVLFVTYGGLLLLGVWYVLAIVAAYVVGIVNGYTLNRLWTFNAGPFTVSSFLKYAFVQIFGLALTVICTAFFVEVVGVAEIAALPLSWPIVIPMTFFATRSWAFMSGERVP